MRGAGSREKQTWESMGVLRVCQPTSRFDSGAARQGRMARQFSYPSGAAASAP